MRLFVPLSSVLTIRHKHQLQNATQDNLVRAKILAQYQTFKALEELYGKNVKSILQHGRFC